MKWLIFVTLKMVETLAFLFVPLYGGLLFNYVDSFMPHPDPCEHVFTIWLMGWPWLLVCCMGVVVMVAIPIGAYKGFCNLIDLNTKWAKDLARWLEN